MYTKTEILAKVNILEAAADPGLSFTALISAINALSGAGVSSAMEKAIVAEIHCLVRTGMIYADGSHKPIGNNPPTGYEDFSVLFTAASEEIMATSVDTFNAATYETTDPQTQQTVTRNTLLDSWTASYTAAGSSASTSLASVASWCNSQGIGNSIETLLEPKEVKYVPDRADLSNTIYIEHKAKDVILAYGLDVLIPEVVA